MDDDETEFLEKVEMVRLIKKFIHSVIHRFCIRFYVTVEVEEQWRREKRVVDEKERAERKIYLFLVLEIGMKCYK